MHIKTYAEKKSKKCIICGNFFIVSFQLNEHFGERPFKCMICEKVFAVSSQLNTHLQTHAEKKLLNIYSAKSNFIYLLN